MLNEFKKDLTAQMSEIKNGIRSDINEIKDEIKDIKREIKNKEEVKQIATDIDQMKIETAEEKEDLSLRIQEVENRLEKMQKEKIRNNLIIITGVTMSEGTEEDLRVAIESKMEELFRVKAKVRRAYKIDDARYIIEMEQWADKLTILNEKAKLKGRDIFIDSELTKTERGIQKCIRDVASNSSYFF
ncbi:hypothetical protein Zmor_001473 [Zophobas morio]|uniref:Uncharacterized protein n=1 Tax=Zophobas morio TaxID=2755281 RepID=A0AA38IZ43_9CUCU|nr:hypothetical protein Zmor_001473 [Zophobas morio]